MVVSSVYRVFHNIYKRSSSKNMNMCFKIDKKLVFANISRNVSLFTENSFCMLFLLKIGEFFEGIVDFNSKSMVLEKNQLFNVDKYGQFFEILFKLTVTFF